MLLLGDTSQEEVVDILLERCVGYISQYCHIEEEDIPEYLVMDMVLEAFNKLNNEGVTNISYGGITETFTELSDHIRRALNACRKVRTISET